MSLVDMLRLKADEAERTRSMVVGPSMVMLLRDAASRLDVGSDIPGGGAA